MKAHHEWLRFANLEFRPMGRVKEDATALADLAVWCLRRVGITERGD